MLKAGKSTLCALRQFGSCVSEVKRPRPAGPEASALKPAPTFLSKPDSSQSGSTSSKLEAMMREPRPGTSSRYMGPYLRASSASPSIGWAASRSKRLPTSKCPGGRGIGSRLDTGSMRYLLSASAPRCSPLGRSWRSPGHSRLDSPQRHCAADAHFHLMRLEAPDDAAAARRHARTKPLHVWPAVSHGLLNLVRLRGYGPPPRHDPDPRRRSEY